MRLPLRGLGLAVLPAIFGPACAGAPPPLPGAPRAQPKAESAPPPAARWLASRGPTRVLSETARGTLVLLGGRRALVTSDGKLELEKAPLPAPLDDLVEVPTSTGTRFVGSAPTRLYRFDDPLGAPVVLALTDTGSGDTVRIRLGAGPGAVAAWVPGSSVPRLFDVATGQPRPLTGLWAQLPPTRLAFLDERRGAAVFPGVGLATTTDGGVSWRLPSTARPGDGARVAGLRRSGGVLLAYEWDGPMAEVGIDPPRLGPPQGAKAEAAPILRWIHDAGMDPLRAAASGGLELPGGQALVVASCVLGRLDLQSGAVLEVLDVAAGRGRDCSLARAGKEIWLSRPMPSDPSNVGVSRVILDRGSIQLDAPSSLLSGTYQLAGSPSGGLMAPRMCQGSSAHGACVRQPDGTWKSVAPSGAGHFDLERSAAGPLADGRLAFLRAAQDDPEARAHEPPRFEVLAVEPGGKDEVVTSLSVPNVPSWAKTALVVQSPIAEQPDGTLRFAVGHNGHVYVVVVPKGRGLPLVREVPGATAVRLRAARGLATGHGNVLASLDGGLSWAEVPAPVEMLDDAGAAWRNRSHGPLEVSEVGAATGDLVRIGWGAAEAAPPAAPEEAIPRSVTISSRSSAPSSGPRVSCTSAGLAPASLADVPQSGLHRDTAGALGKTPAGVRREVARLPVADPKQISPKGWFAEEGKATGKPTKWIFKWYDPREIGARMRVVSMAPPRDAAWGAFVASFAAAGSRVLATVRRGSETHLVRIGASGSAEIVVVPREAAPAEHGPTPVFGADDAEVMAWIAAGRVHAWRRRERPIAVAEIGHADRLLGAPLRDGVPLLLGDDEWALLWMLPIPPADEPAPTSASAPAPARPPPGLPIDGWTPIPPLGPRLDKLRPCGARPAGVRFVFTPEFRVRVDGFDQSSWGAETSTEVIVSGADACLAAVRGILESRGGGQPAPLPPGAAPIKPPVGPTGPLHLFRFDAAASKAEGGDAATRSQARKLACSLVP